MKVFFELNIEKVKLKLMNLKKRIYIYLNFQEVNGYAPKDPAPMNP